MLESARIAAISSLALIAIGCGPAKTRADVSLTLGDVSADGSEVVVQASGKVCDDKLDIRLELDGSTIVASGRGVVPDNEFDYCDRFIDTGGEGRSDHYVSESIRLDPGTYSVRNVDSTSAIEFKLDSGVITSSFPYATLAEAADVASERIALSPARVATIAVADEIDRSLERVEPGRYDVRCDYITEMRVFEGAPDSPNLTVCDVEGRFLMNPGTGPFAFDELQRLGCLDVPTQVDLPPEHWGVFCSFDRPDLGLSSDSAELHVRGHVRSQSGNDDELLLEDLYVWVQ